MLFGPETVSGFDYAPGQIPPDEEQALVAQIRTLPLQPFRFHGYLGNRRVASFGYRYDYVRRKVEASQPIPDFLLAARACAAKLAGLAADKFVQALVTEYAPGAGIGWHKDKPMFEKVVALSFAAPCVLRLRRPNGRSWERASAEIPPRSSYLLSGAAREDWQHSITPMDRLRYSVTFRSFRPS